MWIYKYHSLFYHNILLFCHKLKDSHRMIFSTTSQNTKFLVKSKFSNRFRMPIFILNFENFCQTIILFLKFQQMNTSIMATNSNQGGSAKRYRIHLSMHIERTNRILFCWGIMQFYGFVSTSSCDKLTVWTPRYTHDCSSVYLSSHNWLKCLIKYS